MREVEILHDYIMDLLNGDETLAPADILVMSPKIEEYSGSIKGIFSRGTGDVPAIPFRIVDRKLKDTSEAVDTFFKILSLGEERFTSASVLGIAECDEIRERFNLNREDMDKIGKWVRETPVFWGIDAGFKDELGLPGIYENTWSFGFDRMLMGGIMNGEEKTSLGILPYPEIEGGDLLILGRFITFFNSLREVYLKLKKSHSLAEWSDVIKFILDTLFTDDEDAGAPDSISSAAVRIKNMQEESQFSGKLTVNVIIEYLKKALSESGSGRDFVSGSLTFCEMLPMRSIPCRVICLLGMNDSAFPRKSKTLSFDLTSASPKRGDRSARDEDKYLFLETLVSARENLYISFTGQSMNSSDKLNPSVVVSELIEYADRFYKVDNDKKKISDFIFKTHHIQPYNPEYFIGGSGFFTYRETRVEGARSYALLDKKSYRFMEKPLPPLAEDEKTISINDLAAFIVNPSKSLLNKRLGLYFNRRSDGLIEQEPFSFGSLDLYKLNAEIIKALQEGKEHDSCFNILKASGILPHGTPGVLTCENSFIEVKEFYNRFRNLLTGKSSRVVIDLDINGFRLTGSIDSIYNGRNIFFRYASAKGKDIITAWITHLALCASGNFNGDTLIVSKKEISGWDYIAESRDILGTLIKVYETGMMVPVPLFPAGSLKFAEKYYYGKKGDPVARAFKAANDAFINEFRGGDSDDLYIRKLFGDSYILSKEFQEHTLKVYAPVFENMKEKAGL